MAARPESAALALPVGGVDKIEEAGVPGDGELDGAVLWDIDQLPRPGGDGLSADTDVQPSAEHVVHLVVAQGPGKVVSVISMTPTPSRGDSCRVNRSRV